MKTGYLSKGCSTLSISFGFAAVITSEKSHTMQISVTRSLPECNMFNRDGPSTVRYYLKLPKDYNGNWATRMYVRGSWGGLEEISYPIPWLYRRCCSTVHEHFNLTKGISGQANHCIFTFFLKCVLSNSEGEKESILLENVERAFFDS